MKGNRQTTQYIRVKVRIRQRQTAPVIRLSAIATYAIMTLGLGRKMIFAHKAVHRIVEKLIGNLVDGVRIQIVGIGLVSLIGGQNLKTFDAKHRKQPRIWRKNPVLTLS